MAQELKRKGVTLTLLWQEYRTAHPDDYGYTWFCDKFAVYQPPGEPDLPSQPCGGCGDAHAFQFFGRQMSDATIPKMDETAVQILPINRPVGPQKKL